MTIDIETAADKPKRMRTDEGSLEERSLPDLIAANNYTAQVAATLPPWGLRMARIQPGGTVPGNRARIRE